MIDINKIQENINKYNDNSSEINNLQESVKELSNRYKEINPLYGSITLGTKFVKLLIIIVLITLISYYGYLLLNGNLLLFLQSYNLPFSHGNIYSFMIISILFIGLFVSIFLYFISFILFIPLISLFDLLETLFYKKNITDDIRILENNIISMYNIYIEQKNDITTQLFSIFSPISSLFIIIIPFIVLSSLMIGLNTSVISTIKESINIENNNICKEVELSNKWTTNFSIVNSEEQAEYLNKLLLKCSFK